MSLLSQHRKTATVLAATGARSCKAWAPVVLAAYDRQHGLPWLVRRISQISCCI